MTEDGDLVIETSSCCLFVVENCVFFHLVNQTTFEKFYLKITFLVILPGLDTYNHDHKKLHLTNMTFTHKH